MGICNIPIKTDLKNKSYNALQACKQGDTLILDFDIFDNSMMADLTGFACDLRANKADGKGYQTISNVTITIATGEATIKCPSSLTQFAGQLKIELTFTDIINNLQKTTFDIIIQVDQSVIGNDDGSVPTVIITALEELNTTLVQTTSKVSEATTINNTLTNTNNTANGLNNTLNISIGNANTSKSSLDISIDDAEQTITDLQAANNQYTNHISNMDIHVTKIQKDNWDRIDSIANMLDIVTKGTEITDENGTNITDENLVAWTM